MNKTLFALLALSLSTAATPALAAENYLCELTDASDGAQYMVIVPDSLNGGPVSGLVLQRDLLARVSWQVIPGTVQITQVPDDGPLLITVGKRLSAEEWALPENRTRCFVNYTETSFQLFARTDGITGQVTTSRELDSNPGRLPEGRPCPDPFPEVPATQQISCKAF